MVDFTQSLNQQIASGLGFTGQVGGGGVDSWLNQNPAKIAQYTQMRKQYQPNYSFAPQPSSQPAQPQTPSVTYMDQSAMSPAPESVTINPQNYTQNSHGTYAMNPAMGQNPGGARAGMPTTGTVNMQAALKNYNTSTVNSAAPQAPAPTPTPQATTAPAPTQTPQVDPYQQILNDTQNNLQAYGLNTTQPLLAPEQKATPLNAEIPNISDLNGMDTGQQLNYLATQGTYGKGIGQDASDYFLTLLQNNAGSGNYNVNPTESTYLQTLGIDPNSTNFLGSLNRYLLNRGGTA